MKAPKKTLLYLFCLLLLSLSADPSQSQALQKVPKKAPKQQKRSNPRLKSRVGAVCLDGYQSKARGPGACSHHGGVKYWLYRSSGQESVHIMNPELPVLYEPGQNIPLLPLSPEDLKNFHRFIPFNDDWIYEKQHPNNGQEEDYYRETPRPASGNEQRHQFLSDYLFVFIQVLIIVLLFVLVIYIIKRVL